MNDIKGQIPLYMLPILPRSSQIFLGTSLPSPSFSGFWPVNIWILQQPAYILEMFHRLQRLVTHQKHYLPCHTYPPRIFPLSLLLHPNLKLICTRVCGINLCSRHLYATVLTLWVQLQSPPQNFHLQPPVLSHKVILHHNHNFYSS